MNARSSGVMHGPAYGSFRLRVALPALAFALAAALAPAPGRAQGTGSGWSAGAGLALAIPQGEFREFVDTGYGVAGDVTYRFGRSRWIGLRLDAGYIVYGHETVERPLSRTVSRVTVDVTTSNNIVLAALGPHVELPAGPVRPYANALVGLAYFYTQSSVEGDADLFSFARSTNFDDFTFGLSLGGGLYVPLSDAFSLDVGLQYRTHGETRYLREGSIEEDGEGNVSFSPIESETDFLLLRVGVSWGAR